MKLEALNVGLAEQVDQLEAALGTAWHVPETRRTLIDRATAVELIDQPVWQRAGCSTASTVRPALVVVPRMAASRTAQVRSGGPATCH